MSGDPTAEDPSSLSTDIQSDGSTANRFARLKSIGREQWFIGGAAAAAFTLLALAIMWGVGYFHEPEIFVESDISPAERFAQECDLVREQNIGTFHLAHYEVSDDMVPDLADLDWLETIIFDHGAVSDRALETIARLPKLRHLRLRLSPITDEGLKTLSGCQTLWYLNLPHADCTSAGVRHLQSLTNLRQLRLGSARLGNDVTQEIAKLKGLRGVHLIGIPITDEGVETLAEMPYLESLYLDDSAVTEAGWERLFRKHPDLHVHVNQRHHDRDPKAHAHHD